MIAFNEPRLKVQRAKKHVTDLNRDVLTFERREPYRVIVDRDFEPGYHLLRIIERFKPPEDWALLVGDVLHNLSSALDILACDIMRQHGRGIASVHFPFAKDIDDLEIVFKKRTVHRARPNILNQFRLLKPYDGGDKLLYGIHKLNISDKHKLLVPVFQTTGIDNLNIFEADGTPRFKTVPGVKFMMYEDGSPPEHKRILFKTPAAANMKFEYNRRVAFEVLFAIRTGELEPVVPTLNQMVKMVDQVIGIFEGHFNNHQQLHWAIRHEQTRTIANA